jgi:hypothetical protein
LAAKCAIAAARHHDKMARPLGYPPDKLIFPDEADSAITAPDRDSRKAV